MSCEYGYTNCQNEDQKCYLCINELHYVPIKVKARPGLRKKVQIDTKRQGSMNEVKTHDQIKASLDVSGTPNSGAGKIKGDLEIGQLAMIECKTTTEKNKGRQPGAHSFSIRRDHLEKLKKEANEARKEFHFLVFSFQEHDDDLYVVTDLSEINSMIATLKHDRLELLKSNNIINVHKTRTTLVEAKNTELLAEIEHLKAKLKYYEQKDSDEIL